jgi:hypothetical protein
MQKSDQNIGIFEKRQFFAENWEKSQKIVIITLTPCGMGHWLSLVPLNH